jgi:hypothetical protein
MPSITRGRGLGALLATAALVLVIVGPAAGAARAQGPMAVPISGMVVSVVDTTIEPPPPEGGCLGDWVYSSYGSGQMSHLGRITFEITHCTAMDWETGSGAFDQGTTTFVAANGDRLELEHSGTFSLAFPSETEGYSFIDMTWEIVGGTGRFEGATGGGYAAGVSDLFAGTTTASYWGTISYDASHRSSD